MAPNRTGRLRILWLLLTCAMTHMLPTETTRVATDNGKVEGFREEILDKTVDIFYGIPFAKPPVGNLRFKHPVPIDPWRGTLNATRRPNACVQGFDRVFGNFSGSSMWNPNTPVSEDCLYLNVWVPRSRDGETVGNKAVMVWVYGGGFYSGSSALDVYDAKILAVENDVIVVSMQYRVGALGYLAMGHKDAQGNAGMYDQLLALDWVQRNIHHFGGDAHRVTLFGESAGSVSVSMHLLSPLSQGKFARAIMESGSALSAWATISRKEAMRRALKLATLMGCDQGDVGDIIACLRTKPATMFTNFEFQVSFGIFQFPFVPIVDGTFLTETPTSALQSSNFKKAPLLLGSNKNEGAWFLIYQYVEHFSFSDSLISRKQFMFIMDSLFHYYPQYPQKMNIFGKQAVAFQYTHWQDPNNKVMNRVNLDQVVGDYHLVCGVNDFAEAYARANLDVYYYYFTHRSSQNLWPKWMGVMHADEINYVFGEPLNPKFKYHKQERELSRKIMKYWTNFAKTG